MDSWSRPSKGQATPAPYYLGTSIPPYCQTCGRVIGARKVTKGGTEVKYCSDKCKKHKPSQGPHSLECRITDALTALLQGETLPIPPVVMDVDHANVSDEQRPQIRAKDRGRKGDPRITVLLSELELAVFGDRTDPEKVYGRRKNRKARWVAEVASDTENDSRSCHDTNGSFTDESDDDSEEPLANGGVLAADHVREPQTQSEVNFSVGGERGWGEKIDETPEMLTKRREGQRKAEERELVRNVARRAVVFGLKVDERFMLPNNTISSPVRGTKRGKKTHKARDDDEDLAPSGVIGEPPKRKCEALMNSQVIEPSFAKGDWAIRFRDD